MRAARIHEYGSADVLEVEEVPRPELSPGQVLIEVKAAAVNPVDWKIRSGAQRAIIKLDLPAVLGMDVSGVVAEVGAGVTGFGVGDEVYCSPSHKTQGGYAEFVRVEAGELARKPASLSHEEAASLPLVALTAWACLEHMKIEPGDKVLIQAGAGGVGTAAIQMAKARGAIVATTCGPSNEALVRELGADIVINYREQRFEDALEPQDAILESIGGRDLVRARAALKRGGRLAAITTGIPEHVEKRGPYLGLVTAVMSLAGFIVWSFLSKGVRVRPVVRAASGEQLEAIAAMVEAGQLKPVIDSTYALDDIAEAHRRSESKHARGKIIVVP